MLSRRQPTWTWDATSARLRWRGTAERFFRAPRARARPHTPAPTLAGTLPRPAGRPAPTSAASSA
eukprot:568786-Rhodomonas_salina.1